MQIESISPVVAVEVVSDGYVPLIIRFGGYQGPINFAPLYWRTGNFKTSTIEIGLNPSNGKICKIVVVGLNEVRPFPTAIDDAVESLGIPIAKLSQWNIHNPSDIRLQTIDVDGDAYGVLGEQSFAVFFGEVSHDELSRIQCNQVVFFLDHSQALRGFEVTSLTCSEMKSLRFALNIPD